MQLALSDDLINYLNSGEAPKEESKFEITFARMVELVVAERKEKLPVVGFQRG